MKRGAFAFGVVLFGLVRLAGAQPFAAGDLPPALRPWVAWVRDEIKDLGCAIVDGSAVCIWPGRLDLRLGATGGAFGLSVVADRATDLSLPGDPRRWPQEVRLDGRPAVVIARQGVPLVHVAPGTHRLEGRFVWPHLPDSLPVPSRLALVDLAVEGRSVEQPRRDEGGLLWLRPEGQAAGAAESLRIQVFRRIADGIPLWFETRLSFEVSGKAREVELAGALLPQSVVVAVRGELPARVDPGGRLRVQVRAGRFAVTVLGRIEGQPGELRPPQVEEPWPSREVWVFAANEALRQVELTGLSPIDPSRTDLPSEWRKLPAFVVEPGRSLAFQETRRGDPVAPPDRIELRRELWLDLSGAGYTIRDRFSGGVSRTWRLDLQRPGELGRASLDGAEQLITANPASRAPGVELRRGRLGLEADSRVPRSGRLPAVGWSADVEQLGATLHLPPGFALLAATGVDAAPGAWTERWTLLAFFFVIVVALAAARLFGRTWGVVALLAVALTYGETGAPFLVWLSLLGAIALGTVAKGRLARAARVWRGVSLIALVLILAPFFRDQLRTALYPQVGASEGTSGFFSTPFAARRSARPNALPEAPPPPAVPAATAPPSQAQAIPRAAEQGQEEYAFKSEDKAVAGVEGGVAGGIVGGLAGGLSNVLDETVDLKRSRRSAKGYAQSNTVALEQDPRAVLQTGPGVPTWSWRSFSLRWSGPVKSDQTMRLWLLTPALSVVLVGLRVLLVLTLAVRLVIGGPSRLRTITPEGAAKALAILFFLLLAPTMGRAAQGEDIPDRELLDELKKRLTRAKPCQPQCLATSTLRIRLGEGGLAFDGEVHAEDDAAWAIPGPPASWAPSSVRVDGQATNAIARLDDGFLYVRLAPGVHRVEVAGPLPRADRLTLQLRERPFRATADLPGWEVSGLRADGPPDTSIQISRRLRAGEKARTEAGQYAPWLEVTRTLVLGLTWRVETEVRRISPTGAPVALRIPLLPGEAPTETDLETEHGIAVISLGRDETEASWSSTLPVSDALELRASEGVPWSEVWRLQCGVIWQCEFAGLAPVSRQSDGVLVPEFRPWPRETLALRFLHPLAVPGQTVTLDRVRVETTPGERLTTTVLSLTARSSREETLLLTLPGEAEVQEVLVAGAARPEKADQGRLRLSVPAGRGEVVVKWREPRGATFYQRVPSVGFKATAVNVETLLHVPENRWLLLTRGPSWGPAVLFWSYLLFALLVAFVLGLVTESPLGVGEWLLLGLGLSQTSVPAALVVVLFFLALSWRSRRPRPSAAAHDLLQILLAAWALFATAVLYDVVHRGLLLRPDMQVEGAGSSDLLLRFYTDRVADGTPAAAALSVPLWVYRGLMLAWALWLAARVLKWGSWAFVAFGANGYWRALPRTVAPPPPASEADAPSAPGESAGGEEERPT